jgi:hypothetical protein
MLTVVAMVALLSSGAIAQEATPDPSGTEAQPLPIGVTGTVAGLWKVRVIEAVEDPHDLDPAASWFNDWLDQYPAPAGHRYFSLRLEITNAGLAAMRPATELQFVLLSDTGFSYDVRSYCGNVPGGLAFDTQMDAGDTIEANFCWLVEERHVPTLKLIVERWIASGDTGAAWFAVRDDAATPVANR